MKTGKEEFPPEHPSQGKVDKSTKAKPRGEKEKGKE